jgi:hypothetical protein
MRLRPASVLVIASVSAAAVVVLSSAQVGDRTGIWAADGRRLDQVPNSGRREFPAPNGLLMIREGDGVLSLVTKGRVTALDVPATPSLTELLWSPDSTAFVINASDGGLIGTWDAYLFSVGADGRLMARDVRELIEPQAKGVAKCATNEVVNLGAGAWLQSGKALLIVLEVPPHTSCRNPGALVGYRVSFPDLKVLERVGESMLRSQWGELLGRRFAK